MSTQAASSRKAGTVAVPAKKAVKKPVAAKPAAKPAAKKPAAKTTTKVAAPKAVAKPVAKKPTIPKAKTKPSYQDLALGALKVSYAQVDLSDVDTKPTTSSRRPGANVYVFVADAGVFHVQVKNANGYVLSKLLILFLAAIKAPTKRSIATQYLDGYTNTVQLTK